MSESLTQRRSGTIDRLRGRGRLTEEYIREATSEVRIALLEADVAQQDEQGAVMGSQATDLNLNVTAPAVILMAGLQGAGKTTTVGKLARHLKEKKKKKVMVVSADVYRPAAIEQLRTLAGQNGALFFPSD